MNRIATFLCVATLIGTCFLLAVSHSRYVCWNVRLGYLATNIYAEMLDGNFHVNLLFTTSMYDESIGRAWRVPQHATTAAWLPAAPPMFDANVGTESNIEVIAPLWWLIAAASIWPMIYLVRFGVDRSGRSRSCANARQSGRC